LSVSEVITVNVDAFVPLIAVHAPSFVTVGVEPSAVSEEWGAEYDLPEGAGWGFGPLRLFGENPSPARVFFAVPDVRAAAARLQAKGGYTVSDVIESPVCTMAFVNDDDGNALCLHQRKSTA
jgi:hypothetical protein